MTYVLTSGQDHESKRRIKRTLLKYLLIKPTCLAIQIILRILIEISIKNPLNGPDTNPSTHLRSWTQVPGRWIRSGGSGGGVRPVLRGSAPGPIGWSIPPRLGSLELHWTTDELRGGGVYGEASLPVRWRVLGLGNRGSWVAM